MCNFILPISGGKKPKPTKNGKCAEEGNKDQRAVIVWKESLTEQGLGKEKNRAVGREVCKGPGGKKGVQNGGPDCLISE